jgi:flagellar FliL protein
LLSKNNNEEATSAITQEKALQKSRNQLQQVIFIDLKDFIVNLNSSGNQSSFLKMSVSLEVGNLEDEKIVKANMPKIRDSFQLYLRQLRPDDLRGSAGLFRLREELLLRINKIMYPASIKDILFNELIIQ